MSNLWNRLQGWCSLWLIACQILKGQSCLYTEKAQVTFVGLFHLHTNTNVSSIVLTLDVGVDGFFGDPQEYHLATSC